MSKNLKKLCQRNMMTKKTIFLIGVCLLVFAATAFAQKAKKQKIVQGKICGNPNVKCKTDGYVFDSFSIPFELPKGYIIYESKPFYAVILKSQNVKDILGDDESCREAAMENERISAQRLFPNNKVFAQGCGFGPLYYSGVNENVVFLAVYGGSTLAEAQNFLKEVNSSGKFRDAYIKKLQAHFNGT